MTEAIYSLIIRAIGPLLIGILGKNFRAAAGTPQSILEYLRYISPLRPAAAGFLSGVSTILIIVLHSVLLGGLNFSNIYFPIVVFVLFISVVLCMICFYYWLETGTRIARVMASNHPQQWVNVKASLDIRRIGNNAWVVFWLSIAATSVEIILFALEQSTRV